MGLFERKIKCIYKMNKKQYKEMKKFYKKLGFSDKQCEKLCGSCFGSEIVVDESMPYNDDWEFCKTLKNPPPRPSTEARGRGLVNRMVMSKSAVPDEEGFCMEQEICAEPAPVGMPVPLMAGAAMMSGSMGAAMPMGMNAAMFNTAKTHTAPENEQTTPLDKPQAIFSANVNTASWSYVRTKVLNGQFIDKDFVRIEELINSYPYKLKKPKDDALFSVSVEKGDCLWNDDAELMFVGIKGKKADKKVKQNLAFLVDVSGSMEDSWILVQMSIAAIVSKLGKGDIISIIAYSDNTTTVVKNLECDDMGDCVKAILSIEGIGGCTYGSEGLENAYKFLSENYDKEANNRVFIFTDGDFNFGITNEGGLSEYIKKKRETGIYLSVVGYGMSNFKDDNMEALARNGNGNYTIVTNPADILDNLWEKLISNLVTIAKDVKISVELNPKFVKEYRLIGYDARVLTQKEFNDTSKAVDGIGSEHNVAALIEFKRGTAEKQYSSRYVNTSTADNSEEFAFIEIRYKDIDGNNLVFTKAVTIDEIDNAESKNVKAASIIAAFGLCVKKSEYAGKADKNLLKELTKENILTAEDDDDNYNHYSVIKKYANE